MALVIDASTSMRDGRTQAGRTKLAAAVEAGSGFVDTMAMRQDQAAVTLPSMLDPQGIRTSHRMARRFHPQDA